MSESFSVPILFLIFNRLETTRTVFEMIREVKPCQLFIAADGYRINIKGERERCEEIKKYVMDSIDWECEVKTLFRDKNLGCGSAVSSAITWFFNNVDDGIILEDDCLPDKSFFYFCEELLIRYRDNEGIYMISGDNFVPKFYNTCNSSYYFSSIPHIWGWASWKRSWNKYDYNLSDLNRFMEDKLIDKIWQKKNIKDYWHYIFRKIYDKKINTWDYQWVYAIWKNKGVCIAPNCNLVSNIGFSSEGTHTLFNFNKLQSIPSNKMEFPLSHPPKIAVNREMDNFVNKNIFLKGYCLKIFLKKLGILNLVKKVFIRINR